MKNKHYFSVYALAFTVMAGASMFTGCSKDDTGSEDAAKEERTTLQQRIAEGLKVIAERLNLGSWDLANTLNRDFNSYVLTNPAFSETMTELLQQQIEDNVETAGAAAAEQGFLNQSVVDLSGLKCRLTLKEDKSGFDITPADCFELVQTVDGVTTKLAVMMSGEGNKVLSERLSDTEKGLAVILLVPAKMEFAVTTTAQTGVEHEVFRGELDNDIRQAGELMDMTKDEWNVKGYIASSVTAAGGKENRGRMDFNMAKNPETKKFTNKFTVVQNERRIIEVDAESTHQGNLLALLRLLPELMKAGPAPTKLPEIPLLDILVFSVSGNSVDRLKVTLLDDIKANFTVSDVGEAADVMRQLGEARRTNAGLEEMDALTQELNGLITASLEVKGQEKPIPMKLITVPFGTGFVTVPAVKFADEEEYTPMTQLLDAQSLIYIINIIGNIIK